MNKDPREVWVLVEHKEPREVLGVFSKPINAFYWVEGQDTNDRAWRCGAEREKLHWHSLNGHWWSEDRRFDLMCEVIDEPA